VGAAARFISLNQALAVQVEQAAMGLGLEPAAVLSALTQGSARSFALEAAAGNGSASGLVASAGRFIAKDVAVCEEVAEELGADLGALLSLARVAGSGS
jgi:3-hydroxyisobutyrate dehydrogenase-like beta-hydroxyacid dehydrogenase